MSKIWWLTKILFKNNFISGLGDSKKQKNKKGIGFIGFGILLLFVFGSIGLPIIFALDGLLEVVPMQNILLSLILPIAGVTSVVFGVFSVVSVFYLSKDIDYLLPMPIKANDIMISKFLVALINEYYILFMFILPCFIGVGVGINASFMYYIYVLLIFILIPIIPSVIISFIVLFLAKFTRILKNRDLFMYVSMGLVLVFSFAYSYVLQNIIDIDPANIGSTLQELEKNIIPYFKAIFPFYNSGIYTLMNFNNINGFFSFISFLAFNILALLFIYFIGDKLYLKTLTVSSGNKKRAVEAENIVSKADFKNSSSFLWLLKKEWLIIKRTPIFMLNIVIIVFLMPVVFITSFLFAFTQEGIDISSNVSSQFFENPIIYLVVLAILLFFTCSSMAASTSISREGSNAWFMKIIPVSYFKQVNVKVFFAVVLDLIGVIIVGCVPVIMYKVPILYVISILIPLVIIVILLNYFNILLDLRKPKLKWSEESAAVKQNMNGLWSMLFTVAVCAVFGILAFVLYYYNVEINILLLSFIITLISGLILLLVVYLFYKNNDILLDNVD